MSTYHQRYTAQYEDEELVSINSLYCQLHYMACWSLLQLFCTECQANGGNKHVKSRPCKSIIVEKALSTRALQCLKVVTQVCNSRCNPQSAILSPLRQGPPGSPNENTLGLFHASKHPQGLWGAA